MKKPTEVSKKNIQKWQGNIIIYSKYSGKFTRAFLDIEQNLFRYFNENEKIDLQKQDIDHIELGCINLSQRILHSMYPVKITITSNKLASGKIDFAVARGKLITKEATVELYTLLEQFCERELPDFETFSLTQSKNTVRNIVVFLSVLAVFHYWFTRELTILELGAILLVSAAIIGEVIKLFADKEIS